MTDRLLNQIKFIMEADKLKNVERRNLITDMSRFENTAEHSWHFALMAMTLYEYAADDVNLSRVIKMAILHDLVEVYAGDTFAFDEAGYESKAQRENDAADKLYSLLPPEQAIEFRGLWQEFEKMETADALYAAAIDVLHPALHNAKTLDHPEHPWAKFGVTSTQIYNRLAPVKTAMPELWELVEEVVADAIEKGAVIAR